MTKSPERRLQDFIFYEIFSVNSLKKWAIAFFALLNDIKRR
ncbi:hypothetical protein LEP1GSC047_1711 [Leptospira inadai serovar Lyme str. 10]|uniref:Uncharacterized protein n=1 Tax=Leptospira inadai serovar Lyme str. 10 TaxID=1049790 RepID=V6H9G3_9LEPT|nr:hypothetical protein LEP1GSC047_1711 [Leptospira inadai serovar Lyme str. 10]